MGCDTPLHENALTRTEQRCTGLDLEPVSLRAPISPTILRARRRHTAAVATSDTSRRSQSTDLPLTMLESGRLGTDQRAFREAHAAYNEVLAAGEIAGASAILDLRLGSAVPGQVTSESLDADAVGDAVEAAGLRRADKAMRGEIGFALSELADLLGEAVAIANARGPGASVYTELPDTELVALLGTALGWPEDRIRAALSFLSLEARDTFLAPPAPFTAPMSSRGGSTVRSRTCAGPSWCE
jgi:hypothetical protein